jgi:hypothetical protein
MTSATSFSSDSESDHEWRSLGLGAPARRALVQAGILHPRDLAGTTKARLLELHGIGNSTIVALEPYLANDESK